MSEPRFKVMIGGGDVVAAAEVLLEKARAGEVGGFVVCVVGHDESEGRQFMMWAHRPDLPMPWARLYTATAAGAHDLMQFGLIEG